MEISPVDAKNAVRWLGIMLIVAVTFSTGLFLTDEYLSTEYHRKDKIESEALKALRTAQTSYTAIRNDDRLANSVAPATAEK